MNKEFYVVLIRTIFFNISTSYAFVKAKKREKINQRILIILMLINIILALLYSIFYTKTNNQYINKSITNFLCYLTYTLLFSVIIDSTIIEGVTVGTISIAISFISLIMATGINFFIMKINSMNLFQKSKIEYTIIGIIQIALIYLFFKINRFKDGFQFLQKENEIKIIGTTISLMIIISGVGLGIYSNMGIRTFVFLILIAGGILMIYWIKKSITKYYKEKMKERTVEIQQEQIKQQDEKIKNLQTELADVLQINHKYSHRISAMEKAVTKLGTKLQANEEFAEEYGDILSSIKKLSKEYKEEVASVIKETKLPKTNIFNIDNLLEYMKQESEKDKIDFKLNIDFDISEILETKIPQNKLETMLADHIRDAIIAINCSENKDRRIKVVLDKEDNNYQIKFYDTGIEFEIETLSNLGLKRITTHKSTGGSGIGFMTTFEALKQCKASLIIEEYSDLEYTKAVIIKFDNKNEYRIHSYRAEEIKNKIQDNRIIIE